LGTPTSSGLPHPTYGNMLLPETCPPPFTRKATPILPKEPHSPLLVMLHQILADIIIPDHIVSIGEITIHKETTINSLEETTLPKEPTLSLPKGSFHSLKEINLLMKPHIFSIESFFSFFEKNYHNPSFGLATNARACKVAGQEEIGNEGKCEGMNPHTPKGASILGVYSPSGLPNFSRAISRVKTKWIEDFFNIIEKLLKQRCLKWARMTHLDT